MWRQTAQHKRQRRPLQPLTLTKRALFRFPHCRQALQQRLPVLRCLAILIGIEASHLLGFLEPDLLTHGIAGGLGLRLTEGRHPCGVLGADRLRA